MTVFEKLDIFMDGKNHDWIQKNGEDAVPGWYFGLEVTIFLLAIAAAIILGSYLNGAKWINNKNIRVEGKEFVRSSMQKFVYRMSMILMASLLLFTAYMGSVDGTTGKYKNDDNFLYFIPFFRSSGSLLYQCNIAGIFILPWLMYFNKVKAIAIVAPFTFLGASTTVFSQTDLADGNGFDGFEVHRKVIEHILLMVLPIFVMVSNRYQYTTKGLVGSFLYTAVFNALVAFALYYGKHTHFDPASPDYGKDFSQGEFFRVAEMLGKDSKWLVENWWTGIVFIYGSITFVLISVLWFVYNFVYYASTTKVENKWDLWDKEVVIASKEITIKLSIFALFGKKFITGPIQWFKQFKAVEKESWKKWAWTKSEIISK